MIYRKKTCFTGSVYGSDGAVVHADRLIALKAKQGQRSGLFVYPDARAFPVYISLML